MKNRCAGICRTRSVARFGRLAGCDVRKRSTPFNCTKPCDLIYADLPEVLVKVIQVQYPRTRAITWPNRPEGAWGSASRPCLVKASRRIVRWHPEQINVWCSKPRTVAVFSGATFVRISSASHAVQTRKGWSLVTNRQASQLCVSPRKASDDANLCAMVTEAANRRNALR